MACRGGYCSNQCLCNQDCSAHTPKCSSNAYNFTDPNLSTSYNVRTYHVNQLRVAINQERNRRDLSQYSFGSNVTTSTLIYGSHFYALKNALNGIQHLVDDDYTTSMNISYAKVKNLRTKINNLRVDCICNSNCDGYHTCNCHNNCGCNYSDKRLKSSIKYL